MITAANLIPVVDPLAGLRLTDADRTALGCQGFVATEYRTRHGRRWGPYFRLHWRRDGRQHVRYLGCDATRAQAVRAVLADLHRPQALARELAQLQQRARARLRRIKTLLQPQLDAQGFHLHGYVARQARPPSPPIPASTSLEVHDD